MKNRQDTGYENIDNIASFQRCSSIFFIEISPQRIWKSSRQ